MSLDVKELLFKEPIGENGTVLFASQADLARAIRNVKGGGFDRPDRSEESIRVYLSQVLRPITDKGSRPLSSNLERALRSAIEFRVGENEHATKVADEIVAAIKALKDERKLEHPTSDELEWGALIKASEDVNIKNVVVVTQAPAENQSDDDDHAPRLTRVLMDRVLNSKSDSFDEECTYTFLITEKFTARKMRTSLIRALSTYTSFARRDNQRAEDMVAEAELQGRLRIYHLDYDGFLPPMCVFNPLGNDSTGFNLYYHSNKAVSVAVMDEKSIENWGEKFYDKFLSGEFDVTPVGNTLPLTSHVNSDQSRHQQSLGASR